MSWTWHGPFLRLPTNTLWTVLFRVWQKLWFLEKKNYFESKYLCSCILFCDTNLQYISNSTEHRKMGWSYYQGIVTNWLKIILSASFKHGEIHKWLWTKLLAVLLAKVTPALLVHDRRNFNNRLNKLTILTRKKI